MPVVKAPPKKSKAPQQKPLKGRGLTALALVAILFLIFTGGKQVSNFASSQKNDSGGFNKSQYSVNDPLSVWAVVNKGRILPGSYIPPDLVVPNVPLRLSGGGSEMQLRQEAAGSLQQMFTAASQQNIQLMLSSGYRSYDEQVGLYKGYVSSQGQQNADYSSARPGHSEHQLGLAVDVEPTNRTCEVEACFADTAEGKWVAANSYKYGFIIRYPQGKDNLTGYEYEPWHIRYVGHGLANEIYKTNQTLEQFFSLPTYNDYITSPYKLKSGG